MAPTCANSVVRSVVGCAIAAILTVSVTLTAISACTSLNTPPMPTIVSALSVFQSITATLTEPELKDTLLRSVLAATKVGGDILGITPMWILIQDNNVQLSVMFKILFTTVLYRLLIFSTVTAVLAGLVCDTKIPFFLGTINAFLYIKEKIFGISASTTKKFWEFLHYRLFCMLTGYVGLVIAGNFFTFWAIPIGLQGIIWKNVLVYPFRPFYTWLDECTMMRNFAKRWVYTNARCSDFMAQTIFLLVSITASLSAVFLWQVYYGRLTWYVIMAYYFVWVGFGGRVMGGAYTFAHKEGHNRVFYRPWIRNIFGNVFENFLGPFFGNVPYCFTTSHVAIHHRLDGGKGDTFYQWDLDRTSWRDFICSFLHRILLHTSGQSSIRYFRCHHFPVQYRLLCRGCFLYFVVYPVVIMIASLSLSVIMSIVVPSKTIPLPNGSTSSNFFQNVMVQATLPCAEKCGQVGISILHICSIILSQNQNAFLWSYLEFLFWIYLQPFLCMTFFLAFMNFGFHGFFETYQQFRDETEGTVLSEKARKVGKPRTGTSLTTESGGDDEKPIWCVNSITIVEDDDDYFGESDHMQHHHALQVYYRDLPTYRETKMKEFIAYHASIFRRFSILELSLFILLKKYDILADHYVDYSENLNKAEIAKMLELRAKRLELSHFDYLEYLNGAAAVEDE